MKLTSNTGRAVQGAAKVSLAWWSLCVAGLTAPPLHAQDVTGSSDWQFAATIYGWFPDVCGHTDFPLGGDNTIHVDISTILDHLKMTGQGSFEVHKGAWGAYTDVVYLDVGESKSRVRNLSINGVPIPANVTAAANLDLKSTFWTLAGSYQAGSGSESTFDVLAGVRLASMKQRLDWAFTGNFGSITPPPRKGTRDASADQWDAIVGGKGRTVFGASHRWAMPYYFDIGAGDSDLTWQAVLGLTYSFDWGDIGAVWRYLDYDLKANGPIKDLNFSGPALGATFRG